MDTSIAGVELRSVVRLDGAERLAAEIPIAIEEPLQIVLDGRPVAVLMRTPGWEKELAVGFCLSEGLLGAFGEIVLVQHCGRLGLATEPASDALDQSRNRVAISTLHGRPIENDPRQEIMRLVRSGCGRSDPGEIISTLPALHSALRVSRELLIGLSQTLNAGQRAYRESGGLHAVAVFDTDGRLIVLGEDVGRHNAMDKAIGYCQLRGIALHDKVVFSTGRTSYEMVLKAVRLGIPILLSRSAGTSLAIDLAGRLGCTLIGYVRSERMTIYTNPERVL